MTAAALDAVLSRITDQAISGRVIVALAGGPGSGKSTLAEQIAERLNATKPGFAAVLPMDGFHFDDRVLDAAGLRPRKGAPDTFDVGGLRHTLLRLRTRDEDVVAVPVFDRDLEIARAGARLIPRAVSAIIAEGNYLLLGRPPWASLKPLFDLTILIEQPESVLRERLEARWRGYDLDAAARRAKIDGNDLPNARVVYGESAEPDIRLT